MHIYAAIIAKQFIINCRSNIGFFNAIQIIRDANLKIKIKLSVRFHQQIFTVYILEFVSCLAISIVGLV